MTLSAHTIIGVAVASLTPNHPEIGFVTAFISHFAIDAIPHWDYTITSDFANPRNTNKSSMDRKFIFDLVRFSGDILLGLFFCFLFFFQPSHLGFFVAGVLGGILPDFFQFVYAKFQKQPFIFFQKLHHISHSKTRITHSFWGPSLQIAFVIIFLSIQQFFS